MIKYMKDKAKKSTKKKYLGTKSDDGLRLVLVDPFRNSYGKETSSRTAQFWQAR